MKTGSNVGQRGVAAAVDVGVVDDIMMLSVVGGACSVEVCGLGHRV